MLRRVMSALGPAETMDLLLDRVINTKSNQELVELIISSPFAENVRNK